MTTTTLPARLTRPRQAPPIGAGHPCPQTTALDPAGLARQPGNQSGAEPQNPNDPGHHCPRDTRARTRTSTSHHDRLDIPRPFMDDTGRLSLCRRLASRDRVGDIAVVRSADTTATRAIAFPESDHRASDGGVIACDGNEARGRWREEYRARRERITRGLAARGGPWKGHGPPRLGFRAMRVRRRRCPETRNAGKAWRPPRQLQRRRRPVVARSRAAVASGATMPATALRSREAGNTCAVRRHMLSRHRRCPR